MLTLSIAIQKGGSGKTTTAVNLAAAWRQMGKKVLLIDMDPQANLTQALGITVEPSNNLYHVLQQSVRGEDIDWEKVTLESGDLYFIPSTLDLANSEMELVSVYGREKILEQAISTLPDDYDYVIIDCPPSIGMLTANALAASDFVLLPLQAEFLPLKGVHSFMRTYKMMKKQINPRLEIVGFLLTKYDHRKSMNRNTLNQLEEEFGELVFDTKIRSNIALAHSQEWGLDIFNFDKSSNGAFDYMQLAKELLKRLPNQA